MESGVGFQNPLFFIGVVEDNEDPRLEGRVKVRAFGIHGTVDEIPTENLPWATLIIGSHDTNFSVPPLNSWVFGLFIDGRDAQQPMVMGLIPSKMDQIIDPATYGWGAPLGDFVDRAAMGKRHEDYGQPTSSRLSRAEDLEETYNLPLETNRVRNIEIAGGGSPGFRGTNNSNLWSGDDGTADTSDVSSSINVPAEYRQTAYDSAVKYGVPPDLYFRLIQQESRWDPNAQSRVGAIGLTQVMPETAKNPGYGVKPISNLNDTDEQLRFGAEYLSAMYKRTGSWDLALAAYNSGIGSVNKYGGIPPFKETQDYVDIIYGGWKEAGGVEKGLSDRSDEITASVSGASFEKVSMTWEEPNSAYNAKYPYNRVIETPGGHVIELDSTQGSERIMIWHPSGSYIQMSPSTNTYKSSKDVYDINEQNYHMYIGGSNIITIEGDSHVLVKGNKVEEIRGNYTQIVHGSISMGASEQININGGAETQIRSARLDLESNVENLNLKVGKKIVLSSGEGLHLKSKNIFLESTEEFNLKSGTELKIQFADGHLKGETLFLDASAESNIKSDIIKIGGGSQTNINSSVVKIDDIVHLAPGDAASPGAALESNSAEDATQVEMPEPPTHEIPNTLTKTYSI